MLQKIRIGKDIYIEWFILSNGYPFSLEGKELKLEMTNPAMKKTVLPINVSNNIVRARYSAKEQKYTGIYSLTLWENFGKFGQTCIDNCKAFQLVSRTCQESSCGEEQCVTLNGNLFVGVRGESAYEIALRLGFTGSEKEWVESLKGEKGETGNVIYPKFEINDDMELIVVSTETEKRFNIDDDGFLTLNL